MSEILTPTAIVVHTEAQIVCPRTCSHLATPILMPYSKVPEILTKSVRATDLARRYGDPVLSTVVRSCTNGKAAQPGSEVVAFDTHNTMGHDHVLITGSPRHIAIFCCQPICCSGRLTLRVIRCCKANAHMGIGPAARRIPAEPIAVSSDCALTPQWTCPCVECGRVPLDWSVDPVSGCTSRCTECAPKCVDHKCIGCGRLHVVQ